MHNCLSQLLREFSVSGFNQNWISSGSELLFGPKKDTFFCFFLTFYRGKVISSNQENNRQFRRSGNHGKQYSLQTCSLLPTVALCLHTNHLSQTISTLNLWFRKRAIVYFYCDNYSDCNKYITETMVHKMLLGSNINTVF